ncbi:MAG: hypothetical protein HY680_01640 [Chloroflexi bacterium]|nr:hypothetical protein [Chloroflexota bacterium]
MKLRVLSILFPLFLRPWAFQGWDVAMTLLVLYGAAPAIKLFTRLGVRKPNKAPRVVFGPTPLINSVYHSRALKAAGVDSVTVVRSYGTWVTANTDFDVILNPPVQGFSFFRRWYLRLFHKYFVFVKLLWTRDVFFYYFDGFYLLRGGPLRWLEVPALKMLGKRIIVMPYGGDMTVASDSRELPVRYALVKDYPIMAQPKYVDLVRRQVRHFTQHADAVIGALHLGPDHLPRIDYLLRCHFAIDEQLWSPNFGPPRGVGDLFRVLHAPNHRNMKGTRFLIEAVQQLKAEGLNIQLVLLERVPNTEVRGIMADCHAVADQFVLGWYALTAVEAMASGKPVLCYLRPDLDRFYQLYSHEQGCPVINTPIERIAERLRWLYYNPQECERIGRESRAYVERYHSLEGFGGFLKGVVDSLYSGKPFDDHAYWTHRAQGTGSASKTVVNVVR